MSVRIAIINDLHFGINDSQRLYKELHQFSDFLEKTPLDFVVIDGDYFDRKMSMTDSASYLAVSFFNQIFDICKKKSIKLRMVQGTLTHELNQLQIFESRQYEAGVDFKVIKTVQKEDICGLHVLYLPEEYPLDAEEYYKEFKQDKYNIIFGHGTWDFVAFDNQIEHGKQTATKSAPVFIFDEWKDCIPNGFISFGHIHSRNVYKKKIFYSGSFTRWSFGERSERGFTYAEYDIENKSYKVEFIDNKEAPKFDVATAGSLNLVGKDATEIQTIINEQLKATDNIAIDLSGLPQENIELLKKAYAQNSHIKLEVKEKPKVLKESAENSELVQKYQYIIKKQLPINQIIQRYCKENLNVDISIDAINEILKKE